MTISCLGFNTILLPCFPVKYSRPTTLRSTLLWYFDFVLRRWFVQSLETLPWEITRIFDWQADIPNQSERSVRWRADRLKKAPRPCRRFFKLLPPQSPRGLSALARLYYLACPTKTAMLRRLLEVLLKLNKLFQKICKLWSKLIPARKESKYGKTQLFSFITLFKCWLASFKALQANDLFVGFCPNSKLFLPAGKVCDFCDLCY